MTRFTLLPIKQLRLIKQQNKPSDQLYMSAHSPAIPKRLTMLHQRSLYQPTTKELIITYLTHPEYSSPVDHFEKGSRSSSGPFSFLCLQSSHSPPSQSSIHIYIDTHMRTHTGTAQHSTAQPPYSISHHPACLSAQYPLRHLISRWHLGR